MLKSKKQSEKKTKLKELLLKLLKLNYQKTKKLLLKKDQRLQENIF